MNYYIWLLRIVHILGGVIWVGGTLIMTFFISPAAGATAEAGQKFMSQLMFPMKFGQKMAAAGGLTILAGLLLFWEDSAGFTSPWMSSSTGIGFSIGAAFALVGFAFGVLIGRNTRAMAQLGAQIQGKPSEGQLADLQKMRKQQVTYSYTASITLIISLIFMAISRYLTF